MPTAKPADKLSLPKGTPSSVGKLGTFFGTLKREIVHHRKYRTRQEAMAEISEYIEVFYNRQRRHANLGNLSPAA